MEFQKIINLLETVPDNKDLVKNKSKFMINNKKKQPRNKDRKTNNCF